MNKEKEKRKSELKPDETSQKLSKYHTCSQPKSTKSLVQIQRLSGYFVVVIVDKHNELRSE